MLSSFLTLNCIAHCCFEDNVWQFTLTGNLMYVKIIHFLFIAEFILLMRFIFHWLLWVFLDLKSHNVQLTFNPCICTQYLPAFKIKASSFYCICPHSAFVLMFCGYFVNNFIGKLNCGSVSGARVFHFSKQSCSVT